MIFFGSQPNLRLRMIHSFVPPLLDKHAFFRYFYGFYPWDFPTRAVS